MRSSQDTTHLKRELECLPSEKGTYVFISKLPVDVELEIGSLGKWVFCSGIYCYSGSANGSGGLRARIAHHLRMSDHPTWHFDYLRFFLAPLEVWFIVSVEQFECKYIQRLREFSGSAQTVNGFGSSDCRSSCVSHLVSFPMEIFLKEIFYEMKTYFPNLKRSSLS